MAIVQVSRITHRKGLSENLPQLAGAELGWVIDQRKLYIGNGTVEEGAPAVGNTEILTQYSDILALASSYTYKGEAGGYTVQTGPSSTDNITRSIQSKFDDFASVKDFGAKGDGTSDDTDAINRALFQLFCRESNSEVRRSLFFPAGTYRVTNTIKIPPYAKLYGEGMDSSIIQMDVSADSTFGDYVARTADSLQQVGANIGNNGAITPRNIEVYGMTFKTSEEIDAVFVEDAQKIYFENVRFQGPLQEADLTTSGEDIACVRFDSSAAAVTEDVTFNACHFTNMTWGFDCNQQVKAINVSNSKFTVLYRGAQIGTGTVIDGGAQGFKFTQNLFDTIAYDGIIFGDVNLNVSAFNVFLDVGTNFGGGDATPVSTIVDIQGDNNVSIGDMFERSDANDLTFARINLNGRTAIGFSNGERLEVGAYTQTASRPVAIAVNASATTITTIDTSRASALDFKYIYRETDTKIVRFGTLRVVPSVQDDSTGTFAYSEDYTENNTSGITLLASANDTTISIQYTSTEAGSISFTLEYLR